LRARRFRLVAILARREQPEKLDRSGRFWSTSAKSVAQKYISPPPSDYFLVEENQRGFRQRRAVTPKPLRRKELRRGFRPAAAARGGCLEKTLQSQLLAPQ
jgi:hypothetical protein